MASQRPAHLVTQPPGAPAARFARRGFTMIEILIVIGIIILLVAIGVIAFGALDQSGKLTRTMLANAQAMLGEYEAINKLREKPEGVWRGTGRVADVDLWAEPAIISTAAGEDGKVSGGNAGRYEWSAVANTQLVYRFVNRLPNNKKLMTQIPTKQVHGLAEVPSKGNKLLPQGTSGDIARVIDPPLLLDGWNNPILFVGSGGLVGVVMPDDTSKTSPGQWTVTSVGRVRTGQPLSRNRRPFFASAGPDGDFATGEDNLYSFEQ